MTTMTVDPELTRLLEDYRAGRAAMAVFDLIMLALALRASRASGHETHLGYVLVVPAMVSSSWNSR